MEIKVKYLADIDKIIQAHIGSGTICVVQKIRT